MATTTPNYGLRKPTNADNVNVALDIAGNMDLLDAHGHTGTYVHPPTVFIAASDASVKALAAADYVCDGTADEVQINAAIAALASVGGVIQLSEGTFTTAATITINRDYVTLRGSGIISTQIRPASNADHTLITVGTTANRQRVHLSDFTLYGRLDEGGVHTAAHGVIFRCNAGTIERVRAYYTPLDGFRFESFTTDNLYEIMGNGLVVSFQGRDGVYVSEDIFNSEFYRLTVNGGKNIGLTTSRHGIYCLGTDIKFVACHPYGCQQYGLYAFTPADEVQVIGGEYETCVLGGINFDTVDYGTIIGPVFYGNEASDVILSNCDDVTVIGAIARSGTMTTGQNFNVFQSTNCQIIGGVAQFGVGGGVRLNGSSRCRVTGLTIRNVAAGATAGLRIDDSSNNEFNDNTIEKGVSETGTSNTNRFVNNTLTTGVYTLVGAATAVAPVNPVVSTATAQASIANSTTETALVTYTIPANTARAGTTYRVTVRGSTDHIATSGTLNLRLRIGGTAGASLRTITVPSQGSGNTNRFFTATYDVVFRSVGASGSAIGTLHGYNEMASQQMVGTGGAQTVDTTADKDLVWTAQWATADAGNIARVETAVVELLRP